VAREIAHFLALTCLIGLVGCGGSTVNRQLVSISVSPTTATGANPTFTATGTFNTPPYTVTPLSVSWLMMGPGIDPPPPNYLLASGSYMVSFCPSKTSTYTVIAYAPANPSAPTSGSVPSQAFHDLVIAHTTAEEGGFVAGTAQFTCQ
jgi:hypothetical protein